MRITYDAEVDALYIRFVDQNVFRRVVLEDIALTGRAPAGAKT